MKKHLFILFIYSLPVHAEIIIDGTLNQNLSGPDFQIKADLGQQYGNNLFHSFQDFNLNSSESATFSGPNNIQNIINRVTGGNPSNIDGLIRSTIPEANMYFLNPYGIIFGPNARLDMQGSFHASTADYLRLGENGRFDASSPEQSLLTVAEPQAFGFLDNSASIEIQGSIVLPNQTLSIIAGNININDGILLAESGEINLLAITNTEVSLSDFHPDNLEELGNITISQSSVELLEKTGIANIDVSGSLGGKIFIRAETLVLDKGSIFADTYEGNGGNIDILVENLQLRNGAKITAHNFGKNQGGSINLTSDEIITFNELNYSDFNIIGVDNYADGIGGNININANILDINYGIISSITEDYGQAGNIKINAKEQISIFKSFISSSSEASSPTLGGDAGNIILNTNFLKANYGDINAFSYGNGEAGSTNINANIASFSNFNLVSENPDTNGGNISLQIKQLLLVDDTWIMSLSEGINLENTGGTININNPQFFILNTSKLDATAINDGKIFINADYFIQSSNSTLEGDILINSGQENFSNSLESLTKTMDDAAKLLLKNCASSTNNSFSLQRRSGLSEVFKNH